MSEKKPGHINVLSLDGGGIRGIIPAMLLAEIEKRTSKPISQLFDIIAGTSTGGILALALSKPRDNNAIEPEFTATALIDLYENKGEIIFPKSALRKIGQAMEERYPAKGLETLLDQYFGQTRLKDALTEIIITSYDIENRAAFFFRSKNARNPVLEKDYDYPMKAVARATSAAPTYFEPNKIEKSDGNGYWALVDGGVFANNPAMCAYVEALQVNPTADICMVSLGTGQATHGISYDQAKGWGLVQWARPILDVVFDGVNDTIHYQLDKLLTKWKYYRFQVELQNVNEAMDDVKPENINRLKELAQEMIQAEDENIEIACGTLLANKFYPLTNKDIAEDCQISPQKAAALLRSLDLPGDLYRELNLGSKLEKRYAPQVLKMAKSALK